MSQDAPNQPLPQATPEPTAPGEAGASSDLTPSALSDRDTPPPVPLVIPDHELLRCIGRGSYGEVWLARSKLGTLRAVKVVHRAAFQDPRPFEREFKGIQKFEPISRSHEGLVDILQIGGTGEYFYYVMELADDAGGERENRGKGENEKDALTSLDEQNAACSVPSASSPASYTPRTLRSDLKRHGRLPVAECVRIGLSLASALAHLHRQRLVHRDIKPANIIFVGGAPKLADIGLVAGLGEARSFVGTEGFIPPEGPGSAQADLYSLGKVLYELSTGKDRHEFPELPENLRDLPDQDALIELNAVLVKAGAGDPHQRYQSAEELHADLALLQGGRSIRRVRQLENRLALARKTGLALAALALVAAGAYFGAVKQAQRARRAEREKQRQLYAADLTLAQHLWENGQLRRVQELLEAHRPSTSNPDDLRGFEWFYWWRLCRQDAQRTFTASPRSLNSLTVSPDGRMVAAAGRHKTVRVWDASSGELLATIPGHNDAGMTGLAQDIAFSPEGRTLALVGDDGTIVWWDIDARRERARQRGLGVQPRSLAFSPNGRTLAFGGVATNTVTLLETASGRVRGTLAGKEGDMVLSVAFSPNGKYLAAGFRDNAVLVWEADSRRPCATLDGLLGFVFSVAFSPDGRTLASADNSSAVVLWHFAATNIVGRLNGHEGVVNSVAFSPDGQTIATGSDDNTVKLWDTTSRAVRATFRGHRETVTAVAFTADGRNVLSAGGDAVVKLWNTADRKDPDVFEGHKHWARSLAFSPDGRTLFSCSRDKTIKSWDVSAGRETGTLTGHQRPVYRLGLSPDGRTLASVSGLITETNGLGEIKLWDTIQRKELATLAVQNNPICSVAFSPDGALLATGNGNGMVRLWNVGRREEVAMLTGHQGRVNAVTFSPDGSLLASGSSDGWVKMWSVPMRREEFRFQAHPGGPLYSGVWSLAFSRDGTTLFSGDADGTVKFWEPASSRLQGSLEGTTGVVYALAIAPDGKTLAAGSRDGSLTLWHLASRRALATFKGHASFVEDVAFSPDGTVLASASSDKTVRLWRAASRTEADSGAAGRQPQDQRDTAR